MSILSTQLSPERERERVLSESDAKYLVAVKKTLGNLLPVCENVMDDLGVVVQVRYQT